LIINRLGSECLGNRRKRNVKKSISRAARGRNLRFFIAAATVLAASLALVSSAAAEPKGIFKVYSDCPTEKPEVALCLYGETTSGEFVIGSSKVPVTNPVILQAGAVHAGGENFNEYDLVPPKDGQMMSKSPQNVPGGLAGLINCEEIKGSGLLEITERATCKLTFENGLTGVTATTEMVATSSNPAILNFTNLIEENGTGLVLPVRVHLKNPLLGSDCYIGSTTSPIELRLTDGTTSPPPPNKPIKGKLGTPTSEVENGYESLVTVESTLVDNSFSVPVAEGCGGLASFLLDPIIDAKLGLPSASGHNTAILNNTLYEAESEAVIASESF
jgi:hypothetical protein